MDEQDAQDHQKQDHGDGAVDEIKGDFYTRHTSAQFDLHDTTQNHPKNDGNGGEGQAFQHETKDPEP